MDEVQEVFGPLSVVCAGQSNNPAPASGIFPKILNRDEPLTKRIVDLAVRVWALWLSAYYSLAASRGLVGQPQESGADMAAGRAESASKTAQTGSIVAE